MPGPLYPIDELSLVTDIVTSDYRTADVFRKYDIEFCCGGRRPLNVACEMRGLDTQEVKKELENAIRVINLSPSLQFNEWPLDFLADYIVYVHHAYLRKALPEAQGHLSHFALGHRQKFTYLDKLEAAFNEFAKIMMPHIDQEEEVFFPYVKRVHRAYRDNESYGSLLVRTLRKPLREVIQHEHDTTTRILHIFRELTGNYKAPEKACVSHRVTFQKLQEIDNDVVQHMHLENNILFPRAIAIETELLQRKDI